MINKFFTIKKIIIYIILIISILIYKSDKLMFTVLDQINTATGTVLHLSGVRDLVMVHIDNLNIDIFDKEYQNLPTLNITLNKKTVGKLSEIVAKGKVSEDTIYRQTMSMDETDGNDYSKKTKIKFSFEGEEYKGKIKIHGKHYPHYMKNKKSYSIKMSKDKLFKNMREFALIIPEEQDIATPFGYYLAKKYLNMKVESYLVKINFNGVDQGIYILEEKLRKELLEKNNLSGVDKIQPLDEWYTQYKDNHFQPYTNDLAYLKFKNISKKDNGQLLKYEKLFTSTDFKTINSLIDIDMFARFEALRILIGDDHMIAGDNFKLLYNNSTGKFFPYFRNEATILKINVSKLSHTFDNRLSNSPIFKILTKNNDFRQLRNSYLYKLNQDRDTILSTFSMLNEKYKKVINSDSTNNNPIRKYIVTANNKYKSLVSNLEYINKYINYSRMYITSKEIDDKNMILRISSDSNVKLLVNYIQSPDINGSAKLKIENLVTKRSSDITFDKLADFLNKDGFILNLDEKLELLKNHVSYKLSFKKSHKLSTLNFSFRNSVTHNNMKQKNIFTRYIKQPKKFSFDYTTNYLNKINYRGLKLTNKLYTFTKGNYIIKEDLIFPYGYNVSIDAGTTLKIASGKSILIYGSLYIKGTIKEPIKISNLIKNKPFGVVGCIGDGKSTVDINYLEIYGGNQDMINGAFLSAQLSLYNHKKVVLKNSFIHHGSADDGLNIKNAEILIKNNIFNANFADQVDLDFCEGMVTNNKFISKEFRDNFTAIKLSEDDNGDGLDFSGSEMIVSNNMFDGFLDKGISVGENTKALIVNNEFIDNRSAITAKDQSDIYVYSNSYTNNKINIEMYQKKKIFKHPSLYNINETHKNKKIKKSKDSHYYKTGSLSKIALDKSIKEIIKELEKLEWIEYE